MKARLFIIVSVMLAALSVNAQNRFEKIAEMEGVTSVYVPFMCPRKCST